MREWRYSSTYSYCWH